MTSIENVHSERPAANVIPFPMASTPQSRAEELALVHDAVLQGAAEVEIWGKILFELRERLLVETLRVEAQCAHLRPMRQGQDSAR